MGNSLRCCLACVLPCGALDVIRIVHLNGQVEEITRSISAGEVLEANPNFILSKPCSQGVVRRILILSPESELKRGNIYFLIPASSVPSDKKKNNNEEEDIIITNSCKKSNYKIISTEKVAAATTTITTEQEEEKEDGTTIIGEVIPVKHRSRSSSSTTTGGKLSDHDNINIISEKKSYRRDHRRIRSREKIRSRDWRPHLESISEDSFKLASEVRLD